MSNGCIIRPAGWLYWQVGIPFLVLSGLGVVRMVLGHAISAGLLLLAASAVGSMLLDKLTLANGLLTERRGLRRRHRRHQWGPARVFPSRCGASMTEPP
ncbi:MAG: hypothetical protein ACKV2O_13440 [Acidimicrobiales bacterium]